MVNPNQKQGETYPFINHGLDLEPRMDLLTKRGQNSRSMFGQQLYLVKLFFSTDRGWWWKGYLFVTCKTFLCYLFVCFGAPHCRNTACLNEPETNSGNSREIKKFSPLSCDSRNNFEQFDQIANFPILLNVVEGGEKYWNV